MFLPPCANDSGSAIGTAADALWAIEGDPRLTWTVDSGREFDHDTEPDAGRWTAAPLDYRAVSRALSTGRVVAWVQGRWEIGPRALGHRSLLAEPRDPRTRDRLNTIKRRESYRPIAPCCRVEDLASVFDDDFPDPHMLYFRRVRAPGFAAVTHVDGTARVQTVSAASNARLHTLLTAVAGETGTGMLCNTSLNFKGTGFVNRMSDLVSFCEEHGIDDMVVGDTWYRRDREAG
ncbi:carbamoyltransferase C-terminal domain-containing protein [Saccharomonospora saliphila]|uniref:carbamoyltransferase C-terminal domain-containing protein n=1 Tax=Saccharomonospora saliphila TaxID=369829 RepID=UPI0003A248F9|nr:carbamoyltransferase C-terminal domain-containing protein [Saccharomonospora saliphila]